MGTYQRKGMYNTPWNRRQLNWRDPVYRVNDCPCFICSQPSHRPGQIVFTNPRLRWQRVHAPYWRKTSFNSDYSVATYGRIEFTPRHHPPEWIYHKRYPTYTSKWKHRA